MEQLDNLRILIIGTEGWVKGGEAPIAQHYFKQLRIKGIFLSRQRSNLFC
jgi:hypothetical protein